MELAYKSINTWIIMKMEHIHAYIVCMFIYSEISLRYKEKGKGKRKKENGWTSKAL